MQLPVQHSAVDEQGAPVGKQVPPSVPPVPLLVDIPPVPLLVDTPPVPLLVDIPPVPLLDDMPLLVDRPPVPPRPPLEVDPPVLVLGVLPQPAAMTAPVGTKRDATRIARFRKCIGLLSRWLHQPGAHWSEVRGRCEDGKSSCQGVGNAPTSQAATNCRSTRRL
jgi:hypothetical protein